MLSEVRLGGVTSRWGCQPAADTADLAAATLLASLVSRVSISRTEFQTVLHPDFRAPSIKQTVASEQSKS